MDGDGVILWGSGTMRTHRPLWLARELGVAYEHRPVHPRSGATREPEFLALNPRHKVPVMGHGDLVLTESAAILGYLSETFPAPDRVFVPSDAAERAKLSEWCFFIMSELDANGLYTMRRHGDLKALYGDSPLAVASARDYFLHQLETMEGRIREAGDFLMGGRIGIADILFASCLDWARAYEIPLPDYLMAYRERMRARPAYRAATLDNYPDRAEIGSDT